MARGTKRRLPDLEKFIAQVSAVCTENGVYFYVRRSATSQSYYLRITDREGTQLRVRLSNHPGNPLRMKLLCDYSIYRPSDSSVCEIRHLVQTRLKTFTPEALRQSGFNNANHKGDVMAFIPVNMEAPVLVSWKDSAGNNCPVDKINSVDVTNPELLEILEQTPALDADGNVAQLSFVAVPKGPTGQVQVIIKADPRLADDEEGTEIVTVLDLTLPAGEAVSGNTAVGALVPNRNLPQA